LRDETPLVQTQIGKAWIEIEKLVGEVVVLILRHVTSTEIDVGLIVTLEEIAKTDILLTVGSQVTVESRIGPDILNVILDIVLARLTRTNITWETVGTLIRIALLEIVLTVLTTDDRIELASSAVESDRDVESESYKDASPFVCDTVSCRGEVDPN
jgi:hypothetical protein